MGRRENLIMDVGMHTGEDVKRFLAAGFDVVAVEANPQLVMSASETFAAELDSGRLTIVAAAVAEARGRASFAVANHTIWSTLEPELIARNENLAETTYRYIDVDTIPFGDVLDEFGVPYYLKVDIEGYDMLCVRALRGRNEKPVYVSIESSVSLNTAPVDAVFDELAELWTLGYRRFRYVDQAREVNTVPHDAVWEGPSWRSAWATLARAHLLRAHHNLAGFGGRYARMPPSRAYNYLRGQLKRPVGWYDLHAALH
jgi:FkbM family methyltransferase